MKELLHIWMYIAVQLWKKLLFKLTYTDKQINFFFQQSPNNNTIFFFFYFVLLLDCLELCLLDSQLRIPVLQGFVLFFCFMWWKKRACGWSNQNCKFNSSNLVNHYTTSSLVLSTHLVNCSVTCWHEWLIVKSHGSNLLYLGMKTTFHMPCWCQIFFFGVSFLKLQWVAESSSHSNLLDAKVPICFWLFF